MSEPLYSDHDFICRVIERIRGEQRAAAHAIAGLERRTDVRVRVERIRLQEQAADLNWQESTALHTLAMIKGRSHVD